MFLNLICFIFLTYRKKKETIFNGQLTMRVEAQRAAPPSQCDRIKRQITQQIYSLYC